MELMFHDDDCGELLDAGGNCPKCGIHPDTQSTAFKTVGQDEMVSGVLDGKTFLGKGCQVIDSLEACRFGATDLKELTRIQAGGIATNTMSTQKVVVLLTNGIPVRVVKLPRFSKSWETNKFIASLEQQLRIKMREAYLTLNPGSDSTATGIGGVATSCVLAVEEALLPVPRKP